MKKLIISCVLFTNASLHAFGCEHGFFPANDLYIPTNAETSIEKSAYSANAISAIEKTYAGLFSKTGHKLIVNSLWDEPKVNAYATKDDNDNPVINLTGGMLGHEYLTTDSLALILCHEVGHFLGGEPKKLRGNSTKKSWSSAEGQADYFATASCMRKVLPLIADETEKNNKSSHNPKATHEQKLTQEAKLLCKDRLCERIAVASYNVALIYAAIDFYHGELSLLQKDDYTTYQTIYGHPNPQCRLDTMVAALQCPDPSSINFNANDPIASACKNPEYRRPRCWYYPANSF
jgi:hypothetical protein